MNAFGLAIGKPKCRRLQWILIAAAFCCSFACRALHADESAGEELTRRIPSYSASYISPAVKIHVTPDKFGSTVLVIEQLGEARAALTLPREIFEVIAILKSEGNKLVVISDIGGGGRDVAIVDYKAATVIDHFWCYQPALSPSHRYIAFKKFFPEHGVDDVQSSNFEMLYEISADSDRSRSLLRNPLDRINRGRLLYPPEFRVRKTARGAVPITHTFPDQAIWSADSERFVLIDSVYPADLISMGANNDGNILPSARVHPSPAAVLILFSLADMADHAPKVSQFNTRLCRPRESTFCYVNLKGASFTDRDVTIDTGIKTRVAFSQFRKIGTADY